MFHFLFVCFCSPSSLCPLSAADGPAAGSRRLSQPFSASVKHRQVRSLRRTMEGTSHCLIFLIFLLSCSADPVSPAALTVSPSRSQFFEREKVSLSCSDGGTVRRNTSRETRTECQKGGWGRSAGSTCEITLFPSDSGLYWCESMSGSSSSSSSIQLSVSVGKISGQGESPSSRISVEEKPSADSGPPPSSSPPPSPSPPPSSSSSSQSHLFMLLTPPCVIFGFYSLILVLLIQLLRNEQRKPEVTDSVKIKDVGFPQTESEPEDGDDESVGGES
ncbi:putative protein TPRXL isoform X1 [Poecilia latipinna]|uniref:putative protein TPRXL isoform X1 n=1 Tax=Poecilia latipinna TaxID=48699 RepID=UPI00072DF926|nr:PREDICTED: putative protein TPRXL isoform X1 [Poecilia latipinna]